jgi:hypothetical protein
MRVIDTYYIWVLFDVAPRKKPVAVRTPYFGAKNQNQIDACRHLPQSVIELLLHYTLNSHEREVRPPNHAHQGSGGCSSAAFSANRCLPPLCGRRISWATNPNLLRSHLRNNSTNSKQHGFCGTTAARLPPCLEVTL